jgi:putative membrane protein
MSAPRPATRNPLPSLWFGVLAGPLAWAIQLSALYALAVASCGGAGTAPLHVVSLLCLIVALLGFHTARRQLRSMRGEEENPTIGARRMLALLGILLESLFVLVMIATWAAVFLLSPCPAGAHPIQEPEAAAPSGWAELARAWEFDPGVVMSLLLTGLLYARGVAGRRGLRRGVRAREVSLFAAGWLALVIALVSPVHRWGEALFSAHMTQHEILMLVAAPLLVLGSPLAPLLRGLPARWARALGGIYRGGPWHPIRDVLRNPLVAWSIHGVVLWAWHAPALFEAALESETVHALQHASFLGSALLFWWALLRGRGRVLDYGAAVLYLFTTAVHSGILGALLTFSGAPWYPAYAATTRAWGFSPLADQQLGGLIMWVPAGTVYIAVALLLFARWMRASGEQVRRREAADAARSPVTRLEAR